MQKHNFKLSKLTRPNVAAMKPYSSARDEYKDTQQDMVFLDANENPFTNGVNRYPDPQQRDLKGLIASQRNATVPNILIGNGSDEVLDLLFRAFCVPGKDKVITLPPTYGMYGVLSATNDVENREVRLLQDFQPDVPTILENIDTNTKLIFICSPNNPTGNLISTEAILRVLDGFNGLVVIDEAYIDFASAASWISQLENYPNLVVTQTLSKAYGMAGIRLGLLFASSEIIHILNTIKPPYNVNSLTQAKATERLLAVSEVEQEVNRIIQSKVSLQQALQDLPFVERCYTSDANFILCKVDDATSRYNQLISKGIVVRNRSSQALCENTLRFTIGTSQENEQLINTLKTLA